MRDHGGANCDCARLRSAGINNILFLTHVGDTGGAELKMIDLCRTVRCCAEIMLFQHGSLEDILRAQDIAVSVCPMPSTASSVRKEGGILSILRAIPGALSMVRNVARKGRKFDVLVCFSQKSFVIASLAKPFMRRPILWFMNDILSPSHFSRALIRVLVLLSRFSADHIALNSQASLNAWHEAGGRRRGVSVIYPGIQDEQIVAQLQNSQRIAAYKAKYSPNQKPLIGMFGRLCRWKGQDVFLRALARLPDVNAIIVGGPFFAEQDYEREIRKLAADLGLAERVTFVGHVTDVMTLMAACDVVAHCSTAPEPFGLVIAEAMLAGTPVIASDAGGAREIVIPGETGQLTPLQDDEALAGAVLRYLADPKWAREMACRATSRAREKFSGAAMADGFSDAIGTL
jgi:glycosyltransferase involved in cell wall biosynthesis